MCDATGLDVQPGRSVGRAQSTLVELLEEVGEVVDRPLPDVDVNAERSWSVMLFAPHGRPRAEGHARRGTSLRGTATSSASRAGTRSGGRRRRSRRPGARGAGPRPLRRSRPSVMSPTTSLDQPVGGRAAGASRPDGRPPVGTLALGARASGQACRPAAAWPRRRLHEQGGGWPALVHRRARAWSRAAPRCSIARRPGSPCPTRRGPAWPGRAGDVAIGCPSTDRDRARSMRSCPMIAAAAMSWPTTSPTIQVGPGPTASPRRRASRRPPGRRTRRGPASAAS